MVSETIVDIIKWAHSIPQCTSITSVQPNGKLLEDTSALWASNEFQCLARRCCLQHFYCTLLSEFTHSFHLISFTHHSKAVRSQVSQLQLLDTSLQDQPRHAAYSGEDLEQVTWLSLDPGETLSTHSSQLVGQFIWRINARELWSEYHAEMSL